MFPFSELSRPTLLKLASALDTGRLQPPYSSVKFNTSISSQQHSNIVAELQRLHSEGMQARHIAYLLYSIARERERAQSMRDCTELVWTGSSDSLMRDTRSVVRDLFATTTRQLLLSSYAIDRGQKASDLFRPLATQMDVYPELEVAFHINVPRRRGDTTSSQVLLQKFANSFCQLWTGQRLPKLYYDPRSLSNNFQERACLHAKCIVADNERVFITSANFTEAAHLRNTEAGVLLTDRDLARSLSNQFRSLIESRKLLLVKI